MFGLFNKNTEENTPEWYAELQESKERWFAFLEKLEAKMEELAMAAIPELKQILKEDDDLYKRTFHNVYSGINGQLNNIRTKARETYEEKIINLYYNINSQVSVLSK
ncbi:MAG TPA: hypothetical protein VFQ56_00155, partial [Flavobacterium sp.]|nr:hypothetical protein [Flavobacterium sp.]